MRVGPQDLVELLNFIRTAFLSGLSACSKEDRFTAALMVIIFPRQNLSGVPDVLILSTIFVSQLPFLVGIAESP